MLEASICWLTENSEAIVIGTVESLEAKYTADSTIIYTSATIHTTRLLKGYELGTEFTVEVLGGRVENYEWYVASSAHFYIGETILIFLSYEERVTSDAFGVAGWAQGKFEVYFDDETGRYRVRRTFNGVTIIPTNDDSIPELLEDLEEAISNCTP